MMNLTNCLVYNNIRFGKSSFLQVLMVLEYSKDLEQSEILVLNAIGHSENTFAGFRE